MKRGNIYKKYSVEDFVRDDSFRKWIIEPDNITDLFWKTFQTENPDKIENIQTAKQIVEVLIFEERPIERKEYIASLDRLKIRISKQNSYKKNLRKIPVLWSKIAAVLIIPFIALSLSLYFSNNNANDENQITQYIVPNGQKSNVILADGTSVWLNSGSKLTYYLSRNSCQRKVHLEGEAYFDVSKDKRKPFLVETDDYTVKVYGTSFNVRSYTGQKESETILKEGSVSIITSDHKELKLNPGQRFLINQENKYQINEIDPDLYICWKDNILKVNNEELQNLKVRMERWYGVKINVLNFEEVKNIRYTLTIKTESFREMLELMKYVTPFTFKIDGENVTLNYKI